MVRASSDPVVGIFSLAWNFFSDRSLSEDVAQDEADAKRMAAIGSLAILAQLAVMRAGGERHGLEQGAVRLFQAIHGLLS